jgi:hypothetical protein
MLRRVVLVRTNVSEEPSMSIIRATRTGELGTTLAVSLKEYENVSRGSRALCQRFESRTSET